MDHANIRLALLGHFGGGGHKMTKATKPFLPLMQRLYLRNYAKVIKNVHLMLARFPAPTHISSFGNPMETLDYGERYFPFFFFCQPMLCLFLC